jgi:DNA-binding response OmpR family regulator
VIDEEESIRSLLHRILEADACAVMTAGNVSEAISFLEGHPDAIDLLIADIAEPSPRTSGSDRRLAPTTKMLLLSVGTTATDSEDAADTLLLHRPFRSNALRDRIRELLGDLLASDDEGPGHVGADSAEK